MRRLVSAVLTAGLLILVAAPPGWAWHRGWHPRGGTHVVIGLGPAFWWSPWWYYPPPVYVYSPPPVIVEEPPVYIQQEPSGQAGYWYYCSSSRAYYPQVQSCPEPWIPVPAQSQ